MKNVQKFLFKFTVLPILFLGISSCCDPCEPTEEVVDKPENIIIPLAQAQKMYDTYSERRVKLIEAYEDSLDRRDDYDKKPTKNIPNEEDQGRMAQQDGTPAASDGFKVARYGQFDYKTLKKYLAFIEQEARKAGVDDISTLRIYLANYPDQVRFDGGREIKEPRRNTFVLIPTLKQGTEDYAFYTADGVDGQRKAFILTDSLARLPDNGLGAVEHSGNQREEASFFPKGMPNAPNNILLPPNEQSLAGNEAGLRPPSDK